MDDAAQNDIRPKAAPWPILDRVAALVGVWALKRIFGADCPDEDAECLGCAAQRLVRVMRDIAHGR